MLIWTGRKLTRVNCNAGCPKLSIHFSAAHKYTVSNGYPDERTLTYHSVMAAVSNQLTEVIYFGLHRNIFREGIEETVLADSTL